MPTDEWATPRVLVQLQEVQAEQDLALAELDAYNFIQATAFLGGGGSITDPNYP